MQIVIDIPEVFYEALKKTDEIVSGQRSGKTLMSVIYNAVANGIPLPKGHGRLIDADALKRVGRYTHTNTDIDNANTIIEAESEDN